MVLNSGDFPDFNFLAKASKKKLPKPLFFKKFDDFHRVAKCCTSGDFKKTHCYHLLQGA
jgi:hypothetical protein